MFNEKEKNAIKGMNSPSMGAALKGMIEKKKGGVLSGLAEFGNNNQRAMRDFQIASQVMEEAPDSSV
jgi:hypothetical protein